jgi:uncharacterized protein YndB with AHSA1/START domain
MTVPKEATMWQGTERVQVAASPEAVWKVISDIDSHARLAGSREIEAIRFQGPLRVGARWEADERIPGVGRFTAVSTCTVYEPPRELAWKPQAPAVRKGRDDSRPDITWWYRLQPNDGGTLLEHGFRVVEPKVGAAMMKAFYVLSRRERTIRRGMHQTLQNVKAAAEGL